MTAPGRPSIPRVFPPPPPFFTLLTRCVSLSPPPPSGQEVKLLMVKCFFVASLPPNLTPPPLEWWVPFSPLGSVGRVLRKTVNPRPAHFKYFISVFRPCSFFLFAPNSLITLFHFRRSPLEAFAVLFWYYWFFPFPSSDRFHIPTQTLSGVLLRQSFGKDRWRSFRISPPSFFVHF